jgi:anion-transporting  ArsA/GET3 family ATPase
VFVVTTSDPAPVREAIKFYRELPGLAVSPAAVIFNRILPDSWAEATAPEGTSIALEQNLARWSAETLRQRDTREEFSSRYGAHIATIPWSPSPPTDLDGLSSLLDHSQELPWEAVGIGVV